MAGSPVRRLRKNGIYIPPLNPAARKDFAENINLARACARDDKDIPEWSQVAATGLRTLLALADGANDEKVRCVAASKLVDVGLEQSAQNPVALLVRLLGSPEELARWIDRVRPTLPTTHEAEDEHEPFERGSGAPAGGVDADDIVAGDGDSRG